MFQVNINIFIFPMGKNPRGDVSPQEFFPAGIFPHGDFFLHSIHPKRILFNGKVFFLHLFTFILYMVWIQVVVKQVGKLYFRFTWSQTQRQFFTLCCPYTCIHSKAAPVRATCLFHLFIHFAKSLDPDQALYISGTDYRIRIQAV